jgi:anti-sigma-K factor RskA
MSRAPLTPLPPDETDMLAAEYALGVLDAGERAAAEARMAADPAFAEAVAAWAARLSPLDDGYAPVPAPDLMPAIERRVFGAPEPPSRLARLRAALLPALGLVAGLLFAVYVLWPEPPPQTRTATLTGEALSFAAAFDGRALFLRQIAGEPPGAGQDHELWLIVGEAAPVSLGLLREGEFARPLDAIPAGAVLAVSLEPEGGSPTGAPTGPVLAVGTLG